MCKRIDGADQGRALLAEISEQRRVGVSALSAGTGCGVDGLQRRPSPCLQSWVPSFASRTHVGGDGIEILAIKPADIR